jgi:hypothetical protein
VGEAGQVLVVLGANNPKALRVGMTNPVAVCTLAVNKKDDRAEDNFIVAIDLKAYR